jgi:hypothetical protein
VGWSFVSLFSLSVCLNFVLIQLRLVFLLPISVFYSARECVIQDLF